MCIGAVMYVYGMTKFGGCTTCRLLLYVVVAFVVLVRISGAFTFLDIIFQGHFKISSIRNSPPIVHA